MLALCMRKVDNFLNVHEQFFGFFIIKVQSADGIFNIIKEVLESQFKLNIKLMVG
jgi:hypothetical protein